MGKKGQLTEKELERRRVFRRLSDDLQSEGYEPHLYTVNTTWANIVPIFLMTPVAALAILIWRLCLTPERKVLHYSEADPLLLLLILLLLVLVHELLHGATWALFAQGHLHSIGFGIFHGIPAPYCTCLVPLKKWQYLAGILMPTLILGVGMAACGIIAGSYLTFFYSVLMMYGGGADIYVFLRLLIHSEKGRDCVFIDYPNEAGYVIFEKEGVGRDEILSA